jgi:hypothetical protein
LPPPGRVGWPNRDAVAVSEGVGSICDRVSVLDLKIWHTMELAKQGNHRERLATLISQQAYLVECGIALLRGLDKGTHYWRTFRQLKMYNSTRN